MVRKKKAQLDVTFGTAVRSYLLFGCSRGPRFLHCARTLFHALFYHAPELESCHIRELDSDYCMKAATNIRMSERRMQLRICLYEVFCYAARRGWYPTPQPPRW